ncbi:hypothetical protein BDQ12DRAFT_737957 [Crucibulum laeve]|uniref:F-box domain-containing protein n=1 Tax=Crucibulum laeve TaxID=68775 RepID=A0A5C3LQC1_9AGAR|nr:hypothetical protein BDQ12DRAFT_737957 [Crucibulum laeve]
MPYKASTEQQNFSISTLPNELLDHILDFLCPLSIQSYSVGLLNGDCHYLWRLRLVCKRINNLLEHRLYSRLEIRASQQLIDTVYARLLLLIADPRFFKNSTVLNVHCSDFCWDLSTSRPDQDIIIFPNIINNAPEFQQFKQARAKVSSSYFNPFLPLTLVGLHVPQLSMITTIHLYGPPEFYSSIMPHFLLVLSYSPHLNSFSMDDRCGRSDMHAVWRIMCQSKVQLQNLRSTVIDKELILYLDSYCGLCELDISVYSDLTPQPDELAKDFFSAVGKHSASLRRLKVVDNNKCWAWSVENFGSSLLPKCQTLKILNIGLNMTVDGDAKLSTIANRIAQGTLSVLVNAISIPQLKHLTIKLPFMNAPLFITSQQQWVDQSYLNKQIVQSLSNLQPSSGIVFPKELTLSSPYFRWDFVLKVGGDVEEYEPMIQQHNFDFFFF